MTGLVNLTIRAASLIGRVILLIGLARWLSVEDVGTFGLVSAGVVVLSGIVGLELHAFSAREIAVNDGSVIGRMLASQFAAQAAMYCVVCAFGWIFVSLVDMATHVDMLLWSVLLLADVAAQEASRVLGALGRSTYSTIAVGLRGGLWAFPLILAAWFEGSTHLDLVWAWWVAGCVVAAALFIHVMVQGRYLGAMRNVDVPWIIQGVRRSVPFLVNGIAIVMIPLMCRLALDGSSGRAAVGVFTMQYGFAIAAQTLMYSVVIAHRLPTIIRVYSGAGPVSPESRRELRRFRTEGVMWTLILSFASASVYWPFTNWLGNPEYLGHTAEYMVIVIGVAALSLSLVPHYELYAQHRDRLMLIASLASCAVAGAVLLAEPFEPLMTAAASFAISSVLILVIKMVAMGVRPGRLRGQGSSRGHV